jgi:hypothetical protein
MTSKYLLVALVALVAASAALLNTAFACEVVPDLTQGVGTTAPRREAFEFPPDDGLTEKSAIGLSPQKPLQIQFSKSSTCFLDISVKLPTLTEVVIEGPTNSVTLATTGLDTRLQINPEHDEQTANRRVLRFALEATGYVMRITVADPSGTYPYKITLRHQHVIAQPMILEKGRTELMRLGSIGRQAIREILIERRALVRFAIEGAPMPSNEESSLRAFVSGLSGNRIDPVAESTFVLAPGRYIAGLELPSNSWPSPLLPARYSQAQVAVRIADLVTQELPSTMQQFANWTLETGLSEYFDVVESFDARKGGESFNLPNAEQRLMPLAIEVGVARTSGKERELPARTKQTAWPTSVRAIDRPELVIHLRPKVKRGQFGALETTWDWQGTPVWNRILQKISLLENLSANKIVVFIPVLCDGDLVYLDSKRQAHRRGYICASASSAVPLKTELKLGRTAAYASPALKRGLATAVPSFLGSFLPQGATWDVLSSETDFVEVIVRGIKGYVIAGGKDWEKLQLTVSLTGLAGQSPTLRATADGQLASGLGTYPSDTQFTRDMEPMHAGALTNYAKIFVNRLRNALEIATGVDK